MTKKRVGWDCILWGVLACASRLLVAWTFRQHPLFSAPLVDGRFYQAWAERMASHGPFVDAPFTMSPLFAWFWWGLKTVGLGEGWGLRGVLSVIGGINVGLLCYLSQALGGRRGGGVMGVMGVLGLPLMMADLNLMKTSLGLMLYLVALATLMRFLWQSEQTVKSAYQGVEKVPPGLSQPVLLRQSPRKTALFLWFVKPQKAENPSVDFTGCLSTPCYSTFFISGFLFGLAALVREPLALTGGVLLAFAVWTMQQRRGVKTLLLGIAGLLAPLMFNALGQWQGGRGAEISAVPAVERQAAQKKSFVFLTAAGGEALYLGLGPEATGTFNLPGFARPDPAWQHADFQSEARRRTGKNLTAAQADRFWRNQALRHALQHPRRTLWLLFNKLRLMLNLREIPSDLSLFAWRQEVPVLKLLVVSWWLWIPLGIAGVFVLWKNSLPARLLGLAVLMGVLGLLPFFVYDRFRLLALLPLLPLSAAALAGIREWLPKRAWAALLMVFISFLMWQDREKVHSNPQPGYDQKLLADSALLAGQKKRAWRHYLHLTTHPLYGADALLQMGGMAMSDGRLGVAEKFFLQALAREPTHAEATANLAMIYAQTHRRGRALVWFQKALTLSAQNPDLWRAVGIFMLEEKKYAAARASFERALTLRGGADEDLLRQVIFSALKAGEKEASRRYVETLRRLNPAQGARAMAQWEKAFGQ